MCISKERKIQLEEFQKKYNLKFKNIDLLNQAFIHTSYTNENNIDVSESYERLEFLGDAVLKLSISKFLYEFFPEYPEGKMTKLRGEIVSDKYIFEFAKKMNFEELIVLGKNEKRHGGAKKESIIACAFEALLGAIFLEYKEKGYKKAYEFLIENFKADFLEMDKKIEYINPKAILQEYTQGIDKKLPTYNLIKEEGKEHNKTFFVEVEYGNKVIGSGSAKTIKQAQIEAARDAIGKLEIVEKEEKCKQ